MQISIFKRFRRHPVFVLKCQENPHHDFIMGGEDKYICVECLAKKCGAKVIRTYK